MNKLPKNEEGTKMIKVCIYFHTTLNGLTLPPKTVFPRGKVIMPTNPKHGIRASTANDIYFGKSQHSLINAINECLDKQGIKIVNEDKIGDLKKFLEMQESSTLFTKNI